MPLSSNVSNLQSRVADLLRDEGITAHDAQDYIDSLNNAQDLLCEMLKLFHERTTLSSVAGTRNYDLPESYMSVYEDNSIIYTGEDDRDVRVRYTTYDEVREYSDLTTKTGTPTVFWIQNNDVYFYPTPNYTGDSNIELEHYRYVASLGGGSTTLTDVTFATEDYAVLTSDVNIFCNGTFTVTLLDAVTNGTAEITIKNTGAGVITIATRNSQVIDGDSVYYLYTQYGAVSLKSDGSNWFIIRKV